MENNTDNKKVVMMSAIDPVVVNNIPEYKEEKARGKSYVNYGANNLWPNYLWDLYNNVATLQSIINGTTDFICGNNIQFANREDIVNKKGETLVDVARKLTVDLMIFGGFAIQVIRNLGGEISEIYHLDFMKVRSDEKNEVFYYCDDWSKWGAKSLVYPKYGIGDKNPTSVFYYKGSITRGVYPTPIYNASLIACELERAINEFHLNNINNGFASNLIINFNNGQPNEEQKKEIEKDVTEKFTGYQNAGRILLSFNDSEENATKVERLNGDDFDDKYKALSERSREQIFTAFRATPNLFGFPNQTTGFNEQEYASSFKLYNRTVVRPMQNVLIDAFDKIYGMKGSVIITPYSLEQNNESQVN